MPYDPKKPVQVVAPPKQVDFTEFVSLIGRGRIKSVAIEGREITGEFKEPYDKINNAPIKDFVTYKEAYYNLTDLLLKYNVPFKNVYREPDPYAGMWAEFLKAIFYIVLLAAGFIIVMRFLAKRQGTSGAIDFGKAKAKKFDGKGEKVTFADVAGIDEIREEVEEVVDYLRGNKRYASLGARIPKGVLLMGAPGTGKTLLAKAIANEADVPFFFMSGSDFMEMFVGIGASRVRNLFVQARKSAPCIVFIDEIDAMGKHRGTGIGGGHDEREQTLNQLLVEMDGFDGASGVIVIGATNRPDILDPGLLRPGRFDRKIVVLKPDLAGRLAILKVHTKKMKLDPSVDLQKVARITPEMTGADLANAANEAALSAGRKERQAIMAEDFEDAVEKVYLGKKMNRKVVEEDRRAIAYHEAGHAIATLECKHADPLHKVSIIPRSHGAGGVTFHLPKEDRYLYSKAKLLDEIVVFLGGRVAEELAFGKDGITTGASNDLERATEYARNMISKWGMDEGSGLGVFENAHANPFLGKDLAMGSGVSQGRQEKVEKRINEILAELRAKAMEILTARKADLEKLAQALLERETLSAEEVLQLFEKSAN